MNNNLLERQFDEILSMSIAQHHPEARKGNLFPIIMDMRYVYPLPVFYSYCMQRKVINTIDLKKRINDFFPCTIIGEKGTSRSTLAYILYQYANREKSVLSYRVDCAMLDRPIFEKLFLSSKSPLYAQDSFLFLFDLPKLQPEVQILLYDYLAERNCKVVAAVNENSGNSDESPELYEKLLEWMGKNVFKMPPLRNHKGDIEFLSNILLNYYNADYGKRIFGFEETAMDELKKYPWPGNITQLSQIISLLVMQTKDLYISESMVRYQLGEEKTVEDAFFLKVDTSMPLKQIDKRIIECVLQQENWNQSKAAKRLKISRSTLWRMLQEN
ncbi:hypothetical protein DWX43_12620 [Clostridium sp. AF19-22AC]|uniref:helix-turn-helix domain-containing protein n=1 Tax=Clostridia TaxID=186801 RepID=UPI000E4EAE7C|nr:MULTISPECIES: helix-turn-helix domain-containing protein [Clostridia]RHR28769.1 hypothetical protein DWX43_12620 [Clostridium sp. AF19-22AC]